MSLEVSGAGGTRAKEKKKVKVKSGDTSSGAARNKLFSKKKGMLAFTHFLTHSLTHSLASTLACLPTGSNFNS